MMLGHELTLIFIVNTLDCFNYYSGIAILLLVSFEIISCNGIWNVMCELYPVFQLHNMLVIKVEVHRKYKKTANLNKQDHHLYTF